MAVWQLAQSHRAQLQLPAAIPLLERDVGLFREAKCGARALVAPLTALAIASYAVDPALAERYETETLSTFEHLLCVGWARASRRYIGPKLSAYVALSVATFAQLGSLRALIFAFAYSVNALNAVAASRFHLQRMERCARAIEPFAVLGNGHLAGLYWRSLRVVTAMTGENYAATLAEQRAICALLESKARIRHMPEQMRRDDVLKALVGINVMECWRANPAALEIADRLESSHAMEVVSPDHFRAVYYLVRGERTRAEEYRQRVEAAALKAGTSWQAVTLVPFNENFTSLWLHDALLGKHTAAELERLSRDHPTLRHEARRARAAYLVLCGRHREAIETMRVEEAPKRALGWTRGQGILARAHNRLGEHWQARELCREALEGCSEDDLDFVVMNLNVQLELILAEAALGDHACGRARAERLIVRHVNVGPLLIGAIHETCARLALLEGDCGRARTHAGAMRACYARTESATLFELADQLAEQVSAAERPSGPGTLGVSRPDDQLSLLGDDADLTTRTHLSRDCSGLSWEERVRRGLDVALQLTEASVAFVVPSVAEREVVRLGPDEPPMDAVGWAHSVRTGRSETTADMLPDSSITYLANVHLNHTHYWMFPLEPAADVAIVPAVLVLGFEGSSSPVPDQQAFIRLARSLRAMLGR